MQYGCRQFIRQLSYHGYDVKDYTTVNARYGTMDDFERLIAKAQ